LSSQVTPKNGSIYINPVVILDIENIGIAVGISLLSCIHAEIYVIAYALPVTGRHLRYIVHPDVRVGENGIEKFQSVYIQGLQLLQSPRFTLQSRAAVRGFITSRKIAGINEANTNTML